jgi:uncharacterized membrane protein
MKGSIPWVLAGLVAGGILHILSVFGIPWLSERDAWARLATQLQPNVLAIPEQKNAPILPFTPQDVVIAYCLFDISRHNVVITSPLLDPAWSLAVSTRAGENFYLVTGADAKKPDVRVLIIPRDRLSEEASTEKTDEGDEQNIIVSPAAQGIVAIRAPLRGESFRAATLEQLKRARCEIQKPPEPVVATVTNKEVSEPAAPENLRSRRNRRRHRR